LRKKKERGEEGGELVSLVELLNLDLGGGRELASRIKANNDREVR